MRLANLTRRVETRFSPIAWCRGLGQARLARFYFAHRPLLVLGMAGYLLAIHLGFAYLVWKSDYPGLIAWRLGLGARWAEFDSSYYAGRQRMLHQLDTAVQPGATLFVGDSILRSLDIGAIADHAAQFSLGGDTARRVAERINSYRTRYTARLVVLHVGTNDLNFRRGEQFEVPFRRVLALIPSATPVVMSAILPVDERVHRGYGNGDIVDANRRLARLCAEHRRCRFIDLTAGLKDAAGGLDPRYHVGDGLHLSGAGYEVWTRAWQAALAPYREPIAVSSGQPAR